MENAKNLACFFGAGDSIDEKSQAGKGNQGRGQGKIMELRWPVFRAGAGMMAEKRRGLLEGGKNRARIIGQLWAEIILKNV